MCPQSAFTSRWLNSNVGSRLTKKKQLHLATTWHCDQVDLNWDGGGGDEDCVDWGVGAGVGVGVEQGLRLRLEA